MTIEYGKLFDQKSENSVNDAGVTINGVSNSSSSLEYKFNDDVTNKLSTELRVNWNDFSKHVWFGSAADLVYHSIDDMATYTYTIHYHLIQDIITKYYLHKFHIQDHFLGHL